MRVRLLAIPLIAIAAIVGGWSAVACGDGGGALTLEEFFAEIEALDDQLEADSSEIDEQFDALSEEEVLDEAPQLFQQQVDLLSDFVDGLGDLDAPDEAADLQEEAVSAGRDVIDLFSGLIDEIEAAGSVDELFGVFEGDEETAAAIERFDQVCLDAEALAADNGITVDLDCEEE